MPRIDGSTALVTGGQRGMGEAFVMAENLNAVMAPYTLERGLYLEFHIDETPMDLWMVAGMWPPDPGTEAEKLWARENRPVPY